jgi:uncharacterized protein YqjF (DUF2071 family)
VITEIKETPSDSTTASQSALARRLMNEQEQGGLFLAAWDRLLFIHYEADPEILQAQVPFELDLYEGRAFVSLVAFTMRGMCLARGSALTSLLAAPLATHRFLNVRTYVRHRGESGIYFLVEWLSSRLATLLGPTLYGLPYRLARLNYSHSNPQALRGTVQADADLCYVAGTASHVDPMRASSGGLDEHLLERYVAFTSRHGRRRYFRVWHDPWMFVSARVRVTEDALLGQTGRWFRTARLVGGHFACAADPVRMAQPRSLGREEDRFCFTAKF